LIHAADDHPKFEISPDIAALVSAAVLFFVESKHAASTFFANNFEIHELDISFDYPIFVVISEDDGVGEGGQIAYFHALVLFLQIERRKGFSGDSEHVVLPVVEFEVEL
jgi:hypothetical protein